METHKKIQEWADKLEYKGVVPDAIKNICNPSTAPLWEELMVKIKPKREVEHIRNNIIINRLRDSKKTQRRSCGQYPIKELKLYHQKESLIQDINSIKENVTEQEQKCKNLQQNINIKYIQCQGIKDQINEIMNGSFLYKKKSEQLEKEISQAEEKLIFFRNLTPVEENQDEQDIANTLKECAEKIAKSVENEPFEEMHCKRVQWLTPVKKSTTFKEYPSYTNNELTRPILSQEMQCLRNEQFNEMISKILHANNNYSIWIVFLKIIEELESSLATVVNKGTHVRYSPASDINEALVKMQTVHIENALYAIKYDIEIKKLEQDLEKKLSEISKQIETLCLGPGQVREIKLIFLMQQKEVGITALCECMRRQLQAMKPDQNIKMEFNNMKSKVMDLQQELIKSVRRLNRKMELCKKIRQATIVSQTETSNLVRKLNLFTQDLGWTLGLENRLYSKEIEVFGKFPIEYNRQVNIDGKLTYVRDILGNLGIDARHLDSNTLQMLVSVINAPQKAPEMILLHLLQSKAKLNVQKGLRSTPIDLKHKKYSMEELLKQESYVSYALQKLETLLKENKTYSTRKGVIEMKQIMKIWLEMPMKDFISPKRLFNGQNCLYYQKLYDSFYEKL